MKETRKSSCGREADATREGYPTRSRRALETSGDLSRVHKTVCECLAAIDRVDRKIENALEALTPEYYSIREVAELCDLSYQAVRDRLINSYGVTPDDWRKKGGRYYILRSSLDKFRRQKCRSV
ncbi:MAG: helix-turn-helix domain-containing protein [Helicobacteraceae bacterium]|jgi:hypothetical protein|nr:helix-turn-helix domain-containing protein [Helicobacteraceae bacterium]